jgi:hypothetical protein
MRMCFQRLLPQKKAPYAGSFIIPPTGFER